MTKIFTSKSATYTAERQLGKGGQGVTWIVKKGEERFVLKELRVEHIDDWKALDLFEREVEALASLSHPGIPKLVDKITEDGRTSAIVQTLIEGESLRSLLTKGPLPKERFEKALRQCLEILVYLHGLVPPLIHRDIQPGNIMLGDRAYLIDFGAVRFGHATNLTAVGTFGYMSPEQIMGRASPASDMFSLGMSFISLAVRKEASELPINPRTGGVDAEALLVSSGVEPRVRRVLLEMTRPGVAERLGDASLALRRLDEEPPRAEVATPKARAAAPRGTTAAIVGAISAVALGAALLLVSKGDKASGGSAKPPSVYAQPPTPEARPSAPPKEEPTAPLTPAQTPPQAPPEAKPIADNGERVTIKVTSDPKGASVRIKGASLCETPCELKLPYGDVEIELQYKEKKVYRSLFVIQEQELFVTF